MSATNKKARTATLDHHPSPDTQGFGLVRVRGIDLFSGVGGISAGAVESGIDISYAVEADRLAAKTFAHNHKQGHRNPRL